MRHRSQLAFAFTSLAVALNESVEQLESLPLLRANTRLAGEVERLAVAIRTLNRRLNVGRRPILRLRK